MQKASLGIIIDKNQNVLLVLRRDVPFWVLPGGGIEDNENPKDTCTREVFEESGLRIESLAHIATYTPINALASTTYVYKSLTLPNATIKIQTQEVQEAAFFPLAALPDNIFFIHKQFLDDWKQSESYPFLKTLSQITYRAAFLFFCKHPVHSIKYLRTRLKNSL